MTPYKLAFRFGRGSFRRWFWRQFCGGCGAELVRDLGLDGWLVVFKGAQIIGAVRDDLIGDGNLTAHGIDGYQRAFELIGPGEVVEELRNSGDFVGFSSTLSWDSNSRALVAWAHSACRALSPLRLSWVRREVLPSIAIKSCRCGHCALIQLSKQRPNKIGSTRLTSVRSQPAQGIPKW
jgi:hypothetical protein